MVILTSVSLGAQYENWGLGIVKDMENNFLL